MKKTILFTFLFAPILCASELKWDCYGLTFITDPICNIAPSGLEGKSIVCFESKVVKKGKTTTSKIKGTTGLLNCGSDEAVIKNEVAIAESEPMLAKKVNEIINGNYTVKYADDSKLLTFYKKNSDNNYEAKLSIITLLDRYLREAEAIELAKKEDLSNLNRDASSADYKLHYDYDHINMETERVEELRDGLYDISKTAFFYYEHNGNESTYNYGTYVELDENNINCNF